MLTFKDISFSIKKDLLNVRLLKRFCFEIPVKELDKISKARITEHSISFKGVSDKKASNKFNMLISRHISQLRSISTNLKATYLHKNSGIPLIGLGFIGIIDRNTNCIELKMITGCNLNCIYCSIDEGKYSKKQHDFVVEKDYLLEELKKVIRQKNNSDLEIHIGVHGEPLFYLPLTELIRDLSSIKGIKRISIDTNGTMLTKKIVDELFDSGLTQLNLSLNAFNQKTADRIAGAQYNLDNVKKIAEYAAKRGKLFISPIYLAGINEPDIEDIIIFAKKIGAHLGIQNFLYYRHGRNPTRQLSWDEFRSRLSVLEKKYNLKLLYDFKKDFNVSGTKSLQKPFNKGDVIKAKIVCPGINKNEMIAVSKERSIVVPNCYSDIGQAIRIKITRDKHNIFYGSIQ